LHAVSRSGAPYVFVPPLLILAASNLLAPASLPLPIRYVLSAAGTLVNLLCKGAIAAYYLRHHEVGDDGAAWQPHALEMPVLQSRGETSGAARSGR